MSIVTTSPTLSYVSSVDVTSISNEGLTKYQILFDASLVTLGNLIMFEYKFQTIGASIPDLDNTSFGFISVEDAIQSGVENQYVIAVPALANTYDGTSINTIQVRVYFGITSSSNNVVVTPWSNDLNVYNPPVQPIIYTDSGIGGAYYDPSFEELYVLLDQSANPYDYDTMKFVVCYFYQDITNATVWSVSDPLTAAPTTLGPLSFRRITVPNIGTVSTTAPYNKVYVSIHTLYDWVDFSNNYYAVSYISNEVVAVEASADAQPDITSVVYNVYSTVAVPGEQTMDVTWTAPGNSTLPFYAIDYYNLYYSIDGGENFTLYQSNIPSTTFTYQVDVGSTGLNLDCGDSILYRIDAITVNAAVEPSAPSSSTNIFKYSEAVTNLAVINTSYDEPHEKVGMTVTFDGVSDEGTPNKGCGAGLQYVVLINGATYSAAFGSLSYTSGASYSIVYTDLPVLQNGTVEVYLETSNTNASPASPLAGLPNTTTYIANNLVLSPVVYEVYPYGNTDQDMLLTWTNPATGTWSVVNYDVQYSIDGGINWITDVSTNNIIYTFDATPFSDSVVNLQFRVLANLTDGSVNYTITSNVESKYTFKYAEKPDFAVLSWAISDPSNITMDIQVIFTNPSLLGTNYGLQYFKVDVNDAFGNLISSQNILYVAGTAPYTVNFDDITYSDIGTIIIAPYVRDTNSVDDITYHDYAYSITYSAGRVPVFLNVDVSGGIITGNIISNNSLKPVGVVIYPNTQHTALLSKEFSTVPGSVDGVTISYILQPNNELYYTFSIDIAVFFPVFVPERCRINVSNQAGIGNTGVILPLP
jgi:hypothetical protein